MKIIFYTIGNVIKWLFGSVSWAPPPWLSSIESVRKKKPKLFYGLSAAGVVIIAGVIGGYQYYQGLPKPLFITADIDVPDLTPNVDSAQPDELRIDFVYDLERLNPEQERPEGWPSVARIDLVDQVVKSGVVMTPALPGQWSWEGDRTLIFAPQQEWPAGTEITLSFDKSLFVEDAHFKNRAYRFTTPQFTVSIEEADFYQDPKEKSLRSVVATLHFSHPVDKQSLEEHLSMSMRPSGSTVEAPAKNFTFTVAYDKNQREAYLHSEPIRLPDKPNYMRVAVTPGVRPATGGKPTVEASEEHVLIPDVYSFLKVSEAHAQIIRNEKEEPEQVLTLQFTDEISETELLAKLTAYLLPEYNTTKRRKSWSSPREVTTKILEASTPVDLQLIENPQDSSKMFNFVFDVPENRYLYVRIDPGLKSVNDFVKSSLYDNVMPTPRYPREVLIMGEGAMLSMGGAHRLSLLTRGVEAYKVRIGKLLPGQLNHLVSQTDGDIKDVYFKGQSFDEDNIVEYSEEIIDLKKRHPKEANYASVDMTTYLPAQKDRFGLFFVALKGWDKQNKSEIHEAQDKRVILVTDLGLLVKNNADQSHLVFVQSISNGRPVAEAKVELLGRNGIPLFTRKTDADGRAVFPSTKGFKKEQLPNVYVVRTADDVSFIPFERSPRRVNYSQFDVGGIRGEHRHRDNLNAFLFSDRGIYRPGEVVELGGIVKDRSLGNVEDIPLEIAIRTPRGSEIVNTKLKLPEKGFFDYRFASEPTSETGTYKVALYLVRDDRYRDRMIGSASFRIEEFQPDTLKIESRVLDLPKQGWSSSKTLRAEVRLQNLFGTAAQDRKVTGRISVRAAQFKFAEYDGFTFTDPYYDPEKRPLQLQEELEAQETNADGVAYFDIPLDRFDRGTYQLNLQIEGFEPGGGRSVSALNRALLSPLKVLVGYKSDGRLGYIHMGATRDVALVAIDSSLQKVALENLRVRIIDVQNVSTLVKQRNGTFKYQTVKREVPQEPRPMAIDRAGKSYRLPTDTPGEYILEILDNEALSLARIHFNVVGHGNLLGKLEKNAALKLKLNSQDYKAGELIEMSITAPYTGSGLITIESDRVHAYKWFQTTTSSTVETIRIPEHLEGNAYVNIAFVRDAGSKDIFTSPLSYAVAPFTIDRSKRKVGVDLEVAPLVRPGKAMPIGYRTSKPSKLVLFAVDEGILQVAGYATPQPLDHFLQKRALEVDTLQILDLILPEFDLVKEVSASGGGLAEAMKSVAANLNPFARTVDKPAVFWSGVIDAGPERGTVDFVVPDTFAGNLRVMAVAVTDEAIGVAEKSTLVRGPFVITPSVLTQAAPGDRFTISAGIANVIDGSGKGLPVMLRVTGSENLEIVGETEKALQIDEGGEQSAAFEVLVKDRLGPAELVFHASSGEEDTRRTAGLSIRPSVPYQTTLISGYTEDGSEQVPLERDLYDALSVQKASASFSPLVLVDGLAAYLEHFPHGCTEQVVSQVFPLVGLMGHPAFAPKSEAVRARFEHLIRKLRERQLGSGGFNFWPGGSDVAEFPSVYVMHFLIESQALGFSVPSDLMSRGRDYLRDYARQEAEGLASARIRAYAIYLLTRLGDVMTNDLVNLQTTLEKEHPKTWRSDLTAVYMAAAYSLLQKDKAASTLVKHYRFGEASWEDFETFHSPLTQDAQYIFLLARHFPKLAADIDGEQVLRLIEPVFKGRYNTLSSAYTILALGAYSQMLGQDGFMEDVLFKALDRGGRRRDLQGTHDPFPTVHFGTGITSVEMQADRALFYLVSQAGYDRRMPEQAVREGLEISRAYFDEDGNEVTRMAQGQEVTVRLKIRALDKPAHHIAVVDLLPGGFEVVRSSVPRTAHGWRADYVDVREDRVVFYGSFDTSVRELNYRVKLTAAGNFVVPPAYAESMYDRSVRAGGLHGSFEVTPAQ